MRGDGLVEKLHETETIIQDYKTKQDIAGDSWVMYHGDTGRSDEYDIFLTGLTVPTNFSKLWKITYQIDGGRKIPNAFCIFMDKFGGPNEDARTDFHQLTPGFDIRSIDDSTDPLVEYLYIAARGATFTPTSASYVGAKFRAISPYRGRIKFEEIT